MMIAGCDRSVSIDEVAPERVEEERAPVLEPLEVPAKLPGREGAAVDVVVWGRPEKVRSHLQGRKEKWLVHRVDRGRREDRRSHL
jgi:hypothetical protein